MSTGQVRETQGKEGIKKAPQFLEGLLAVRTGLEPATSAVTGRHSNQLNYRTNIFRRPTISVLMVQIWRVKYYHATARGEKV